MLSSLAILVCFNILLLSLEDSVTWGLFEEACPQQLSGHNGRPWVMWIEAWVSPGPKGLFVFALEHGLVSLILGLPDTCLGDGQDPLPLPHLTASNLACQRGDLPQVCGAQWAGAEAGLGVGVLSDSRALCDDCSHPLLHPSPKKESHSHSLIWSSLQFWGSLREMES